MAKLTPKLPLLPDKTQPGYQHISELRELVKQNMKMVILTNPGERVMIPEFGVGLLGLLFENFSDIETRSHFQGEITRQVEEYLPFVELEEVNFDDSEIDSNKISVRIKYFIPSMSEEDELYISLKGKI